MFEIICKDKNNEEITHLTQWDLNQTLYIYGWSYELAPAFHFCNRKSERALVVKSESIENGVKVDVPNILLQDSEPVIAYAYLYDEDGSSKTIYTVRIPIRKRVKPNDYEYEENIDIITLTELDVKLSKVYEKCLGSVEYNTETGSLHFYNEYGVDVFEPVKVISNADSYLSSESENPVQNKVILTALNEKANISDVPAVYEWALSSQKPTYSASEVGADVVGTADSLISSHNVNTSAHNDIRDFITELNKRVNAIADSDDTTLDQLSEIVSYIKENRDLISSITDMKVNVDDIVNDLETNIAYKPLSAAQGVALKQMVDSISIPTTAEEVGAAPVDHSHDEYLTQADVSLSGAVSEITGKDLTENMALVSNANGKIAVSEKISSAELDMLDGVRSNIQEQLDGKLSSGETASSATKLSNTCTMKTDLGSTDSAEFDGSADTTIGVTGILCLSNGGLGANDKKTAKQNIGIYFLDSETAPTDWTDGDIWLKPLE